MLQVSLYLKPLGEEKTDTLSLKLFPTFQASGILFKPLYFYCTALVNICAHQQTHKKAGGIAWGGRSILSIVQGPGLVPSISLKLNRRLMLLRKIEK